MFISRKIDKYVQQWTSATLNTKMLKETSQKLCDSIHLNLRNRKHNIV